ncbi:hypothetical protein G28_00229 [Escherichia phage vB_EcoM-G28]|uniref:Uncharacterized protein n=1 Tax=Escherichia phage vB_EcoM-G28 TaxID=2081604 RepID=A0A3S7GSC5_9CAUD|nr:inhibitor of host transcription [Escherichia phage vB_EcoM-G28]AVH86055.1 hypothetical protein G28_00229 [Escherichia phage vB_EcoM-G28]
MMDLQLITTEMVVEAYGDTTDGISVFKGNRRVGYITDLKKDLAKQVKRVLLKVLEWNICSVSS